MLGVSVAAICYAILAEASLHCLPEVPSISRTFSPLDQSGCVARGLSLCVRFLFSLERAAPLCVFSLSFKDQMRVSRLSPTSSSV
uniref:Hypothetical secreted peptide 2002 n=1 Tax=Amblyomma variegatum TaxID=34610 RepID=F0JA05_AMBVA|nr:TPA_inf: hypothetical secreted peptide precursor 2002 [Amblyomma variegatum]